MSREIKFRGRRIDNGEWVYGYLFKMWEQTYILWGTTNGVPNMIEVDPETVGQYTGRQDKNGKDIYHKAIWKFHSVNYTVEWKEEDAGFYLKHPDKSATWDDHMDMSDSKGGTLIGNIYEHPHPLGEKGEGQG